jgi:signal transduction protein with GAF and PtsI domain
MQHSISHSETPPTMEYAALREHSARLRNALSSSAAFFTYTHKADPLPYLEELAGEWLNAEQVEIIVPAVPGSVEQPEPHTYTGLIMIGRQVVGRLVVRRRQPFDAVDELLLQTLGELLGAVLNTASTQSMVDQYRNQALAYAETLDTLLDFARGGIDADTDLPQLALKLTAYLPRMVGGDRASLLLIPGDGQADPQLYLSTGQILSPERARQVRDDGLAGIVLREQRPIIIDETETDRRWLDVSAREIEIPTRCAMAAPLRRGSHIRGVITVTTAQTHLFDTTQLNLLELTGCHISLVLQTAQLEQQRKHLITQTSAGSQRITAAVQDARTALATGAYESLQAILDRLAGEAAALHATIDTYRPRAL